MHEVAWNQMAQELQGRPFTDDEIKTRLHGRVNRDILSYLTGHEITDEEYTKLATKKENIYMQLVLEDLDNYHLSEGAEDLLAFVLENNIPHTIATASEKVLIDFYEKHLHLSRWFDLANIVINDGKLPGKPAPDIYLKAAEKIGLEPKDCVVIEDAHSGLKSAHAAGIGYIVALGPAGKQHELQQLPGVNEVVTTLAEIRKEALFLG